MQGWVRTLRVVLAVAVGGAVIWATAPYATNYVSSHAVVNAPLKTVLSPLQGRITRRSLPAGTGISEGAPLVAVAVAEPDHRYLEQLRARLTLLEESADAIDAENARLAELREVMQTRIRDYRAGTLARLAAERRAAEAALAAAEAARDNTAAELRRTRALIKRGHATAAKGEADTAEHAEAVAEVSRLTARLEEVRIETQAADTGTFVQEGWNDVPYSQQRLDGIILRRVKLASERGRIEAERGALVKQIALERELVAEKEAFAPVAPSAGVIWKESGPVGETVVPGDVLVQIVDCTARFVEVALPERYFDSIRPGDVAQVVLKGGGEATSAPVTAVLGAGAKFDHPRLAASVAEARSDQLRVLVSLVDAGIDDEPRAFCQVGRSAEVRFARHELGFLRLAATQVVERLTALVTGSDKDPGTEFAARLTGPPDR